MRSTETSPLGAADTSVCATIAATLTGCQSSDGYFGRWLIVGGPLEAASLENITLDE